MKLVFLFFSKKSDRKQLERLWKCIGEKVWKPFTASLAEMSYNVTAFISFTLYPSSRDECQVYTSFLWLCFTTISERGLYLITTLTCADLPLR